MVILFFDEKNNLLAGIQDNVHPFIGDYVKIKNKTYKVKSVLWNVYGDKPRETSLSVVVEE